MPVEPPVFQGSRSSINEGLYEQILDQTREMAQKAVTNLRELSSLLPAGVVEQVELLHDDPVQERRKAARLSDSSIPVLIQTLECLGTAMKDHSPTGMALFLPCPAGVGTLLQVRVPKEPDGPWVLVEVKYCRRQGKMWVAGCELLSEQPPI